MAEWKNLGEKAKNLTLTGLGKAKGTKVIT